MSTTAPTTITSSTTPAQHASSNNPANNNNDTFQLRVMTYNIQQLHDLGPKTWWDQANRAARIPAAIRHFCQHEKPPDVLILNEAFNSYAAAIALNLRDDNLFPYQTPVLGKSLDLWKSTTGNFQTSYTVINGGVTILSRYEIVEQRQHIFTATHPLTWDSWSNKGVAYAKLQIPCNEATTSVHVFGTHLQADEGPVPHRATHAIRMQQLQEIRQFIEHELKLGNGERVIIGGDLNVEYTTESFRNELESTLNTKLYYKHKLPGSFSAPYNWMTRANARANGQDEERNETLDYVLVPTDYAPPTNEPLVTVIPLQSSEPLYWRYLAKQWPETKGIHHDLSDHYPVMATFEFSIIA